MKPVTSTSPFTNVEMGDFEATGHTGDWAKNWARGRAPF